MSGMKSYSYLAKKTVFLNAYISLYQSPEGFTHAVNRKLKEIQKNIMCYVNTSFDPQLS